MQEVVTAEEYANLLVAGTPLIDLRAATEFARGSFPAACNLPILNDRERDAIGKTYKIEGQDAAIRLGHQLVSGEVKEQRIQSWEEFISQHPGTVLYCFRGGLRSRTAQQWLGERGIHVPRVAGGYKAMRRFLVDTVAGAAGLQFILVGGKTGVGKTRLIANLPFFIDLERLANHRGSAFGGRPTPQPSQIDFENRLAIELLRIPYTNLARLALEDESRAIGSLAVPLEFHARMLQSPLAVVEEPLERRVATILHAYIEVNFQEMLEEAPASAESRFSEYLRGSLQRIRKRLGGDLSDAIGREMEAALQRHFRDQDTGAHKVWIRSLLVNYYDPMYEYQLGRKSDRVVFRGNSEEFLRWASRLKYLKNGN